MIKRILYIVLLFLAVAFGESAHGANQALKILEETKAKVDRATAISAKFSFESANGSESGMIYMKSDKFLLSSPSLTNLYDGEDLWSANAATAEINVFTPEDEELAEINPIAVLLNSVSDFNATVVSSTSSKIKIKLTPKSAGSNYRQIILTIEASSKLPESAVLTMSDGTTATFRISSINLAANIPSQRFVFNKSDYPGYKIIDLR